MEDRGSGPSWNDGLRAASWLRQAPRHFPWRADELPARHSRVRSQSFIPPGLMLSFCWPDGTTEGFTWNREARLDAPIGPSAWAAIFTKRQNRAHPSRIARGGGDSSRTTQVLQPLWINLWVSKHLVLECLWMSSATVQPTSQLGLKWRPPRSGYARRGSGRIEDDLCLRIEASRVQGPLLGC